MWARRLCCLLCSLANRGNISKLARHALVHLCSLFQSQFSEWWILHIDPCPQELVCSSWFNHCDGHNLLILSECVALHAKESAGSSCLPDVSTSNILFNALEGCCATSSVQKKVEIGMLKLGTMLPHRQHNKECEGLVMMLLCCFWGKWSRSHVNWLRT